MDFSLSTEDQSWVEKAEHFAGIFAARARKVDEAGVYPAENMEELIAEGFHKLPVPIRDGGVGGPAGNVGLIQYVVAQILARGCPTTSWDLLIHFHQTGVVARLADENQRARWLGDVVENGALMGSLGSEINPAQLKGQNVQAKLVFESLFRPTKGGFLANGTKHFCSMGPVADYLLFWALAPGTESNGEGLTQALIPKGSPGLEFFENHWDEITGLRGSVSWSAKLEDVFIPWENVIGQPGDFVQRDPHTYEVSHTAHLLGAAEGVVETVVEFIKGRMYLNDDDVLMFALAEMDASLQAVRASMWYAIWLWEERRYDEAGLASIRALHSAKLASISIATKAYDICGTRALFKVLPIERMWREIRTSSLHTRDTQLMRLLADGMLDGGRQFSKIKYGEKMDKTPTWEDLGLSPNGQLAKARA
jgi:alkylation response protein AidB-like acyl-CoA dehydrogenase